MLPPIRKTAKSTDVWITPTPIIASLGEFDLDPCEAKTRTPHCARGYSKDRGECGLKGTWYPEERVWCNPPYSAWKYWLAKLRAHGNGIALIFARTETKAFREHVWKGADAILFLEKRIVFGRENGKKAAGATAPSVLIAYGEENVRALETCGLAGELIYLPSVAPSRARVESDTWTNGNRHAA